MSQKSDNDCGGRDDVKMESGRCAAHLRKVMIVGIMTFLVQGVEVIVMRVPSIIITFSCLRISSRNSQGPIAVGLCRF